MVIQYPDRIRIAVKASPEQDPTTGVFTASTGMDVVNTYGCRAEKNSAGKQVMGKDGAFMQYSFDVYLPKGNYSIPVGALYVLTAGGRSYEGEVLDASNGQLNSRLWL